MHVRVVLMTTPEQEDLIIKELMTRKYPLEGKRKGYCQATVSKVTPLDIRIKEECVPQLLADLNALDLINYKRDYGNVDHHIKPLPRRIIGALMSVVHKLTGHTIVSKAEKSNPLSNGWYYTINLGEQKDPVNNGVEEL